MSPRACSSWRTEDTSENSQLSLNSGVSSLRKTPRKLTPVTWMHFYAPFFLVHAGLYGTKLLPNAAGAL